MASPPPWAGRTRDHHAPGDGAIAARIIEDWGFQPMIAALGDDREFYFYLTLEDARLDAQALYRQVVQEAGAHRIAAAALDGEVEGVGDGLDARPLREVRSTAHRMSQQQVHALAVDLGAVVPDGGRHSRRQGGFELLQHLVGRMAPAAA